MGGFRSLVKIFMNKDRRFSSNIWVWYGDFPRCLVSEEMNGIGRIDIHLYYIRKVYEFLYRVNPPLPRSILENRPRIIRVKVPKGGSTKIKICLSLKYDIGTILISYTLTRKEFCRKKIKYFLCKLERKNRYFILP